jgi:hypothetical protein
MHTLGELDRARHWRSAATGSGHTDAEKHSWSAASSSGHVGSPAPMRMRAPTPISVKKQPLVPPTRRSGCENGSAGQKRMVKGTMRIGGLRGTSRSSEARFQLPRLAWAGLSAKHALREQQRAGNQPYRRARWDRKGVCTWLGRVASARKASL